MKKNVLIFGSVIGAIFVANIVYMVGRLYAEPGFETNDALGYAAMVLVFSLIFVGIRNYRNKELNGVISLGKAFSTGALIALVGSTIYVVFWLFYFYLFVPDFMDQYTLHVLADATRGGATPEELAQKTQEMAAFSDLYKSPVFVILVTYFEVLPVGLVVALVSSLILRRKAPAGSADDGLRAGDL